MLIHFLQTEDSKVFSTLFLDTDCTAVFVASFFSALPFLETAQ